MNPSADTDYKQLFTQLIKKQMLVLGPDITLAKVRNVVGLTVDINGDVQKIDGDPQALLQSLINQFVELSGMIVKKTMESILTTYPGMMAMAATGAFGDGVGATAQSQPKMETQQAVSQPSQSQSIQISPQPELPTQAEVAVSQTPEVSQASSTTTHPEPPPITAVKLDSLNIAPKVNKETEFTDDDMVKLNKALEELSNAPLSSEQAQAGNQN